jgi:hypothetical protein
MRLMHLIQILLPLCKKGGARVSRALLRSTAKQLAKEFGDVTAYTRAPAQGLWRRSGAKLDRDDIVVYEVMAPTVDPMFWKARRRVLEKDFMQDEIILLQSAGSTVRVEGPTITLGNSGTQLFGARRNPRRGQGTYEYWNWHASRTNSH